MFQVKCKPVKEREERLNKLKNIEPNQIGILSNARCLGEGVDVPNMDGIAFRVIPNQAR